MGVLKSFREFIVEGRDAPLYHGTNYDSIEGILETGVILPKTSHNPTKTLQNDWVNGVSMTRSFEYAEAASNHQIVLEFDQRKLAQRYRIIPVQYWSGQARMKQDRKPFGKNDITNEYEEFVISSKPIPIKGILKVIWTSREPIDLPDYLQSLLKKPEYSHIEVKKWK